ncbi:zinc finger protein 568-like [Ischnura elegans]|uniref:zinc finger protein 568-like n=1 Tax=Ischnura elegans TaxID=197161 RepID=UPI001ED8A1CA|nr:zinc finger protein 568-like [Ischnura elegans]
MSAPRQNKFEGLCRLCTSVEHNNLHIFGDEGEVRQLASKIRICLPIFVHREDNLPKVVCLPCVSKLENFYNFREACVKAEGTLEAFLKEEQNFPHEPEICLEECNTTKATDPEVIVEDGAGTSKEDEKQTRGRRKKRSIEKLPAESTKKVRRGKGSKTKEREKSPSPIPCVAETETVPEVNVAAEEKATIALNEPLGDLPIPLSPGTNLSQILLPQLGNLHPEDYLLIKEEKFLAGANWAVESLFPPNSTSDTGIVKIEPPNNAVTEDNECLVSSESVIDGIKTETGCDITMIKQSRQFLPPVWDIFEKVLGECRSDGQGTAIVTHRRYIVGKRAFPCALCGNCFMISGAGDTMENGRSGVRTHSLSSDQGRDPVERPYGCVNCGKRYYRRSDLVRHEKTHLASRPFLCRLCGKGFCRKEHAQRHMSLHVGEKPFQCEACMKPFTRKEHLSRHQRCHHPEVFMKAENPCSHKNGDRGHTEVESDGNGLVDVGASGTETQSNGAQNQSQAVAQETALTEAMQISPRKPFECEICVRAFSRREHLVRHRRSHFREQMKAASLTLSSSRQVVRIEDDLEASMPTSVVDTVIEGLDDHENVSFSCPYCTLGFSCQEQLDRHRSRMHPLAEAVSAMIPQSDDGLVDSYGDPGSPTNETRSPSPPHLVSESVLRKEAYSCILCPQTFSRKENLERHLKSVHAGLKPFGCNFCGKRFGRAEQCRKHESRHQQNQAKDAVVMVGSSSRIASVLDDGSQSSANPTRKASSKRSKGNSTYEPTDIQIQNGSENVSSTVFGGVNDNVNGEDIGTGKSKHSKGKGSKKNDASGESSHKSSKGSKRNKVYTCQQCGMEFERKKHLSKHSCSHA